MPKDQYPKGRPVITHFFASQEIRPGDTWKVYLNGVNLQGNMKYILYTIHQPGVGTYPVGFIKIPEDQKRNLSGYIFLNTRGDQGMDFVNLDLTVQIQGEDGLQSEPVSFPLTFHSRAQQENPAWGIFAERDLGPIMISLSSYPGP